MGSGSLTQARRRHGVACIVLAGVFFGPLGVGESAFAARTNAPDRCCDKTCPCEADAGDCDSEEPAHTAEGPCSPRDSEGHCPPGCDDCTCCPGALYALNPGGEATPPAGLNGIDVPVKLGSASSGVRDRVDRPPQPSAV